MNPLERWRAMFEAERRATTTRGPDVVRFTARCPACGRECDWVAGRIGEGAAVEPLCACPPLDVSGAAPAA